MFQGNRVKNQEWEAAMFQDLGSSPASMEAGKAADIFGSFPGHNIEQADAEQAYVKAPMDSPVKTWVLLPESQWPAEWKGLHRPVVPLIKALYGHPDSGTYWEKHCDTHCRSVGFVPVDGWPSCYYMKRLDLFLVVYVDDFKLAGPVGHLAEGWKLIHGDATIDGQGKELVMDDPTPLGQYLGCNHKQSTITLPNGVKANAIEYDMEDFRDSCVSRYVDLATEITGTAPKIRPVATPFLEDSPGGSPAGSPCAPAGTPAVFCPWCNNHFPVDGNQTDQVEALRAAERDRQKKIKADQPPTDGAASIGGAIDGDTVELLQNLRPKSLTRQIVEYFSPWLPRC